MECCKVREQLSCYMDKALDEHTLELIEAHLAQCASCRRELTSLTALVEAAAGIENVEPPAELRDSITRSVRKIDRETVSCKEAAGLLSGYIDGELTPSQNYLVMSHVKICEECAREIETLGTIASVAATIEPLDPPADLRVRIADATVLAPPRRTLIQRLGELVSPPTLGWAGGTAAAVGIAVAVMLALPQPANHNNRQTAQQPQPAPVTARVAPQQVEEVPDTVQNTAEPVQPRPVVRAAVRRAMPRPQKAEPIVAAAVTKSKPNVAKPMPKGLITTAESSTTTEEVFLPPVRRTEASEPAEVAETPEPTPVITAEVQRQEHPALIKVASAPSVTTDSNSEEWSKRIKTQAAMRRRHGDSSGMAVISARF